MALKIPDKGEIENTELNYKKLVGYIDEGVIQIPDFQREFVWPTQKILDLLDSINRGYPLGSLIFWVTSEEFLHSKPISREPIKSDIYKNDFFVIDGQQRLKSLYAAAKRENLEGVRKKIDVLYDLEEKKFLFNEDLSRTKLKRVLFIPSTSKDKNVLFNILESIEKNTLETYISKYKPGSILIYDFIKSLKTLDLVTEEEGGEKLTEKGKEILKDKNVKKMAEILTAKIEYIKEVLNIIEKNPGISRKEGGKIFKKIYSGKFATSLQQFGRRLRWLMSLGLIKKINEKKAFTYTLTKEGADMLKFLEEKDKKEKTRYVSLEKILSDDSQIYEYIQEIPEERREKVIGIRERFNKYNFSIIVVNKTDWEEVCEIFERINTAGQDLSVVDLMIAKTWEKEKFNLREELDDFKEEIGWEIPDATILQTLSLNICGKCRRRDILALNKKEVIKNWEKTKECIRKSIGFVKGDLNIPLLDLIPYPALLVPISNFYYKIGNQEPKVEHKEKIERWFWKASVSNRFDSQVETNLERDSEVIQLMLENKPAAFKYSYPYRTVEDIISQKYSLRSAFSKTILCLFINMRPVNPINNAEVRPDTTSQKLKSQLHHIFPKNYLRKQGVEDNQIDSIVNIMFLPANINKDKRFKESPGDYIRAIENPRLKEAFKTHLIEDLENTGILNNDFNKFLRNRAKQILNRLGELTGENIPVSGGELSPETPFTNETHLREIIRYSKGYLDWIDLYFTRRGLEFLKMETNAKKIEKIRILTGIKQTNSSLREDFKKFRKEINQKGIEVEMRIILGKEARNIHDRWLLSENHSFNIPSINTIGRGQYSEIKQVTSKPPFDVWWENGFDIISEWDIIEKELKRVL